MSQLMTPIIILNSIKEDATDYFSSLHNTSTDNTIVKKDGSGHHLFLDDVSSNIINKNIMHDMPTKQLEPLSTHSEPLLLSPHSIFQKTSHSSSSTTTKHIASPSRDRRPSVITFSCDKESSIFYDTVSSFNDDKDRLWRRQSFVSTTVTDKRSFRSWKKRRSSNQSHISSAYTQRTTNISILHHPVDYQQLQQGIVLCAAVPNKHKQFDSQPKYNRHQDFRKRPLKWTEYFAVMTSSGYLKLYHLCHCSRHENNLLHIALHQHNMYYKKPRHVIDLHPTSSTRQKKGLLSCYSPEKDDALFLSLLSPVDFSWSLSSANTIFYFQTASVRQSQQWYQALYACLPTRCKKPVPKVVNISIPQLNVCIQLPLEELMQVGDENVDLRRVRDSALVLLHRHSNRPVDWNKQTVGLCWKYNEQLDWVIKPVDEEQDIAYLVEPRLIEKTHELELRYLDNKSNGTKIRKELYAFIPGPLINMENKEDSALYYGDIEDHFLFLYEHHALVKKEAKDQQLFCCFKFLFPIKRCKTFPSGGPTKSPPAIIGVIDLLQTKHMTYEKGILYLDEACAVQMLNHLVHDWSTKLEFIQKHYKNQKDDDDKAIKKSGILYMKSVNGRYSTFEQRLCILTKRGDFFIFKSNSSMNKTRKMLDFHLSLVQDVYVYSGQECCSYISGLPIELPSRLFDAGIIVERNQDKSNQCCFVMHYKRKEYIFLSRTQDQKEKWVQSIFSVIQ